MKGNKLLSAVMAACLAAGAGGFAPKCAAADTFTNVYENYAVDVDNGGKWLYRELVPDPGCEGESSFINMGDNYSVKETTTKQTNAARTSTYAHSGEYSWYRTAIQNRGIAINFGNDGTIASSTKYNVSAYMRSDMLGADDTKKATQVKAGVFINYVSSEGWLNEKDLFNLTGEWQKFSKTVTTPSIPSGKTVKLGLAHYKSTGDAYSETRTDKTDPWTINTIYIDDWSIRRALPDDFMATEALPGVFDEEAMTVTYRFNLDIDYRTVTKASIAVNGVKDTTYIESAALETVSEQTREHKLTIKLQNITEGEVYTLTLPDIKDAWGRDVTGIEPTVVGTFPEGQYTIFDDLDNGGKWLYRELVQDLECEGADSFVPMSSSNYQTTLGTDTKQVLPKRVSTDKHGGSYSWYTRGAQYRGPGAAFAAGTFTVGESFKMSAYMKSDLEGATDGEKATAVQVRPFIWNKNVNQDWLGSAITLTDKWEKKTLDFTIPDKIQGVATNVNQAINIGVVTDAEGNADSYKETRSDNGKDVAVVSFYIDDWSIRRALPESFFGTELTDKSFDAATLTAHYTFNLDIDPRTVRAESIQINGAANTALIESVALKTNEYTRVTTLDISLKNIRDGVAYTVSLPELEDAWGRAVSGDTELGFTLPAAVTTTLDFAKGGDKITALADGTIDVNVAIENSGAQFSAEVVAAVCKNGKFTSVSNTPVTVKKGKTTANVSVTAGAQDDAVRIFVLKKSGTMLIPVCAAGELTKQGYKSCDY